MTTDPRIKAAAKAVAEKQNVPFVGKKQCGIAEHALAAADAVMFSKEALEQTARRMIAEDYGDGWENYVPAWVLPRYIAKVNTVVAALRGGQA